MLQTSGKAHGGVACAFGDLFLSLHYPYFPPRCSAPAIRLEQPFMPFQEKL